MDNTVGSFTKDVEENQPNEDQLQESKKQYQLELLLDLFNFVSLQKLVYYAIKLFQENLSSVLNNPISEFTEASKIISSDMVLVSNKFQLQLRNMFNDESNIEDNQALQDRIIKASNYFDEKLTLALNTTLSEYILETDNKAARKSLKNVLDNISHEYSYKKGCLAACTKGFITENYLKEKALASLSESSPTKKRKSSTTSATGDENPELYRILKAWRDAKADELEWQVYRVIQLKTMREICKDLPPDPSTLGNIIGMGKKKMEMFSDELLDIINDYREEHKIKSIPEVVTSSKPKKDTKLISYESFKDGVSIEQIATDREMVVSTIEKHLAHYIGTGDIEVSELISGDKITSISNVVFEKKTKSVAEIKDILGDEVTYSDIRFTIIELIFQKKIKF